MHKCETCSIVFSRKQAYETHLKSKKHVKRSEPNKLHVCGCGKSYSCKQSLYVHKKKCNKQSCEQQMNLFMEQLEKVQQKNEELKEELKQLKAEKSVTTNNNTNNIETQNNNITINLNAHGCENLDYLSIPNRSNRLYTSCIQEHTEPGSQDLFQPRTSGESQYKDHRSPESIHQCIYKGQQMEAGK